MVEETTHTSRGQNREHLKARNRRKYSDSWMIRKSLYFLLFRDFGWRVLGSVSVSEFLLFLVPTLFSPFTFGPWVLPCPTQRFSQILEHDLLFFKFEQSRVVRSFELLEGQYDARDSATGSPDAQRSTTRPKRNRPGPADQN
jgi:hypothetical protein